MFEREISSTFEKNLKQEWLLTNGLGGYAMSTLIGANTRKYHGWLVAAVGEQLERFLVLAKMNESVEIKHNSYSISTNECHNYVEKGYVYQEVFERKHLPEFLYDVEGVKIVKKMAMVHGKNALAIKYDIVNPLEEEIFLHFVPFVNYRSYHTVQDAWEYPQSMEDGILTIKVSEENQLRIKITDATYQPYQQTFYKNMYYRVEHNRGFEDTETHYMPGQFSVRIDGNTQKEIMVVVEFSKAWDIEEKFLSSLVRAEEVRLEKICKIAGAKTEQEQQLAIAADQFIIQKGQKKTIIAGYPWFNDWGRDTLIALEGLTLKTNRFADAKAILKYFSRYIQNGLVPNYIDDNGGEAYNTVDASLWYFEAVYQYVRYTNDDETLCELYPKLIEIVNAYRNGTRFSIQMQADGLIAAGNEKTQLTWMDAKVDDYIPTPRYGKAVEINALWYNALKIMEVLSPKIGKEFDSSLSQKVKESFHKFYNDDGLFDTVEPFLADIRPNQLLAISLSFPVVAGEKAEEIMQLMKETLLTEKGLRTLSAKDEKYQGKYAGDRYARDAAYHQGTVWPWLLGQYAKAYQNVYRKKFSFSGIDALLNDGCIGSVAEIYDGDEPREANGALAQAWSVAAMMELK